DQTGPGTEAVEVRLVSTAGVPQGTDLIVAAGANNPALAFAAGTYLASWDDQSSQTVSARLIAPNGTLGAPFTISSDPAPSDDPGRIGTDGTSFLVMWTEEVDVPSNNWDLYAQRVSAAGALVGGAIPLTTAPGQQILPCVAFDGTNYLVTW